MAVVGIQTLHQGRIGLAGGLGTQVRNLQGVGQGGAGEGQGGGPGHGTGHIGNGVMDDAVLDKVGIGVGGDPVDGLDGAALVDGDVHQHGAGVHGLDHLFSHQLGSLGAGDQHTAHHQVRSLHSPGDVVGIGQQGLDPAAEDVIQVSQALGADIQHGDIGTHAHSQPGCVQTHVAAADDDHVGPLHAGNAAQQDAPAAAVGLQQVGADLDGQAACHFAHGRKQGKAAVSKLNGLVGDAGDLLLQQSPGLSGIGSKVQVGKQDLTLVEQVVLRLQGLLDLDDHVSNVVNFLGGGQNVSAQLRVFAVREAAAHACVLLDIYGVTGTDQRVNAGGGQTDTALLGLNFFGTTDFHGKFLLSDMD